MDGLPDAVAIHIWTKACEEARSWPLRIASPEGTSALLESPDGTAAFLLAMLGPVNAGFDRAAAEDLADRLSAADLAAVFAAAGPGDPNGPKAAAATREEPGPGAS